MTLTLSVSCSDDNDDMDNDSALVGSWEMSETEDGYDYSIVVTFRSNGTGTSSYVETYDGETDTDTENFTWFTDGNILTLTIDGDEELVTYSISGNNLSITNEYGDDSVFTKV